MSHQRALDRLKALADTSRLEPEYGNKLKALLQDPDALLAIAAPGVWDGQYEAHLTEVKREDRSRIAKAAKSTYLDHLDRMENKRVEEEAKTRARNPRPERAPDQETLRLLDVSGDAERVISSLRNCIVILREDPRWVGRLRRNTFSYQDELNGEPVQDVDEVDFVEWAAFHYGVNFPSEYVVKAMASVAVRNAYNPVQEHLESLTWDGIERVDGWLQAFCGCDPLEGLTALYARRFLVSAVARVYEPGCKVDTALILQGGQGALKSTALETLAYGKWFSDSHIKIDNKEGYQSIQGVWIYEFGELDSLRRRDAETAKSFLSARKDKFRPPYGRFDILALRQVVFCASTNEDEFLVDPTGFRRFWVVSVGAIDIPGLTFVLDQLWAEAVHIYKAQADCPKCAAHSTGRCVQHRWWFDRKEEADRAPHTERYQVVDPWQQLIETWCHDHQDNRQGGVHTHDILKEAVGVEKRDITKQMEMRLHAMMVSCGWAKPRDAIRVDGRRARGYKPAAK